MNKALTGAGLAPQCLQLEINESDVVQDASAVRALLQQLRDLGVSLTLDNFGSTTSELALLRDNPFDTVKIDSTLLARLDPDIEEKGVISAALQLVESLRMVSVAQGVENLSQLAILETLGCGCAQGHFVGIPLPMGRIVSAEALRVPGEHPAIEPKTLGATG